MHLACCFVHSAWVNSDNTRQIFDLILAQEWTERGREREEKKRKARTALQIGCLSRDNRWKRSDYRTEFEPDRPNDQLKRPLCLLRQTRQENNLSG